MYHLTEQNRTYIAQSHNTHIAWTRKEKQDIHKK